MKLGEAQELFAECLGKLLIEMYTKGYKVRMGDVWGRETDFNLIEDKVTKEKKKVRTHKIGSQHFKKLAVDINLFKNGIPLTKTEEHKIFGEYWESLNPLCRGGYRYGDGNHYEVMENGWR